MRGVRPTATALVLLLAASSAPAAEREPAGWWASAGPLFGGLRLDDGLDSYRWDVGPLGNWGGQVRVGRGRWGAGVRLWRSASSQASGILGESASPAVRLTAAELLGEARLATLGSVRLGGLLSAGRLQIRYSPDRLTYDPFSTGETIEVRFDPIDEWILGAGVTARQALHRRLDLALDLERSYFSLDTAHRSGDEIVEQRESFGNWTARLALHFQLTNS